MPATQIGTAACLLRPAEPEDAEFLFRLFAESHEQLSQLLANEELWRTLVRCSIEDAKRLTRPNIRARWIRSSA
ncbi:MAG: hypothetical protein ABSD44_06915 [Terracidiphilus sp.]